MLGFLHPFENPSHDLYGGVLAPLVYICHLLIYLPFLYTTNTITLVRPESFSYRPNDLDFSLLSSETRQSLFLSLDVNIQV